jgi:NTE family protein
MSRLPAFRFWPAVLLCLLSSLSVAAPASAQGRPKIGLALGGGAARGIAHAGVLLWLEENRIPVDYIAGTSMGGLVGGAYAVGLSPAEIQTLLEGIDWNVTLAPQATYTDLNFRRKQDRREYPAAFELGLKNGIQLPGGLNSAPGVTLLLSRIAAGAGPTTNFDQLAIPFRCVAVDLYSGNPVTLKDGPLATALRATMAIPGLFTPVERDGMLLIDGGFLDNVPVDVARKMGAEVVIAVDVLEAFDTSKKPYSTLVDVLARAQGVLTKEPNARRAAGADVFLRPNLDKLSALDWTITKEAIRLGREIAEENAAALRKYALPEGEWQAYLAARRARKPSKPFVPRFVSVVGAGGREAEAIRGRLRRELNRPLNPERLNETLNLLSGSNRYAALTYTPVTRADGTPGLLVIVQNKPYGPPFLNFGPDIRSDRARDVTAVLSGRVTFFDVFLPDAEARLDAGVGTVDSVAGEYFLPFNPLPRSGATPFVALSGSASSAPISYFQDTRRVADYRLRSSGVAADVGLLIGRTDELRVGIESGWLGVRRIVGSPDTPTGAGAVRGTRLRYTHDGQDRAIIPTRGLRVFVEGRRITRAPESEGVNNRLEVRGSYFTPSGTRGTVFGAASFGALTGGTPSPFSEFSLGGVLRLGAYQPGEVQGQRYYLATFGYIHQLSAGNFLLGGRTSVAAWGEVGDAWGSRIGSGAAGTAISLSAGLVVETLFGPLLLGGSIGQSGREQLYFSLGRFIN